MQFNVVSQHGRGLEQNEVGVRREYPIRFQASKISKDKESIIDKETQISGSDIKTWTELNQGSCYFCPGEPSDTLSYIVYLTINVFTFATWLGLRNEY